MDQSVTIKSDETPLVRVRNVRKYSWFEDACVWFEHYPLARTININVPLSIRSRGSIGDRFNSLRSIADVVEQLEVDLSSQLNIRIWNHFIKYKFGVTKSESRFAPQVNTSTVVALAKTLNLAFDFLYLRLQLIQNMKHYLYFNGIHLNEDGSLDEYAHTASLRLLNKSIAATTTTTPSRGGDFTFQELQALYQFKHQANRTATAQDLAQDLNRPLEMVKNGLAHMSQLNVEAERIIVEGVTLLWGEDTDLWIAYIFKHAVGSTFPVHMMLSTAIAGFVAKERNMGPMQAHFRINLVRRMKKNLLAFTTNNGGHILI